MTFFGCYVVKQCRYINNVFLEGTLITWRSVACLSTLEVVKETLIVLTPKKIVEDPVPQLSCKMTFASNLKKRVLVETIWKGISNLFLFLTQVQIGKILGFAPLHLEEVATL